MGCWGWISAHSPHPPSLLQLPRYRAELGQSQLWGRFAQLKWWDNMIYEVRFSSSINCKILCMNIWQIMRLSAFYFFLLGRKKMELWLTEPKLDDSTDRSSSSQWTQDYITFQLLIPQYRRHFVKICHCIFVNSW